MELTEDEKLALLEALNKRLNSKDNGLLTKAKSLARQKLLTLNKQYGVDRSAIVVGKTKVGEVGISFSKPKPYIFGERSKEALQFLLDNDLAEITPKKGWEDRFRATGDGAVFFVDTGEFVDWAGWDEGGAKTAVVRGCKPEEVMQALMPKIEGQDITKLLLKG